MSATTVYLETFGCQMNELDSELVRGQLSTLGYTFSDNPDAAQIVLFNTCSVREHAESKVYSRIGIVSRRKLAGENILLGVLGCMAERDGLALLQRYPQVDIMCGPGELDKLPALIDAARRSDTATAADRTALAGNRTRRSAALSAVQDDLENLDLSRAFDPVVAGRNSFAAQVRITRGCNKFCTYCVVPNTRGAEVHRPPDHIIDECRKLADAGALEITLLGQTVNHYRYEHGAAVTISGREAPQIGPGLAAFRAAIPVGKRVTTFAQLLRRIHDEVPAIARLRFVTSYPRDFGRDILETMRDCPRICRYLHAPAQSGSDRILKLMNRGYTRGEYEAFAAEALEILPDATLAGDFIVGFPTETDEDFEASCDMVRKLPFKNNFIFKYSPRPGTVAIDRFKDDISNEVKKFRNNVLLNLQTQTSARVHATWIGRTVDVLIEEVCTQRDAQPAVGGVELRWETKAAKTGQPAPTTLRGRTGGDLIVSMDTPHGANANDFVGQIMPVLLQCSSALLLHGALTAGLVVPQSRSISVAHL